MLYISLFSNLSEPPVFVSPRFDRPDRVFLK